VARTVRDTIADLAQDETTVFLSTHILPVVDELASTVGVLYEGELVTEGAPDELKKKADAGEDVGEGEGEEGRTLEDVFLEVTSTVGTEAG
ncbi:MAG: hypothetical protein SXQ77_00890, partial [Halobacteria archaeon]|nr:hypothetical protein [Halobacteria archaeon]